MFFIRLIVYGIAFIILSAFVLYKFPGTREYIVENLLPTDERAIALKSVSEKLKKIDQNIAKIKTAATLKEVQPLVEDTQSVIQDSEKIIDKSNSSNSPLIQAASSLGEVINKITGNEARSCPAQ